MTDIEEIDQRVKNQHYVPQFLLRNFSVAAKKSQIWVFDKQTEQSFATNIRNVCSETGFYDLQLGEAEFTIDPSFKQLEKKAARVINRILDEQLLPKFDSDERALLAVFVAIQFLRVKAARTRVADMNELLKLKLQSLGAKQSDIDHFTACIEDEPKLISMKLLERIGDFVPFFFFKTWILLKTSSQAPLLISDNPVTLQNHKSFGVQGNLGLGVEGIQIYMPISTKFSLGILCASHEEEFTRAYKQYGELRQIRPDIKAALGRRAALFEEFIAGMRDGTPINMVPDNVLNLNSLQVVFSDRFIYGTSDAFEVARQMIRENPKFKTAPHMEFVT